MSSLSMRFYNTLCLQCGCDLWEEVVWQTILRHARSLNEICTLKQISKPYLYKLYEDCNRGSYGGILGDYCMISSYDCNIYYSNHTYIRENIKVSLVFIEKCFSFKWSIPFFLFCFVINQNMGWGICSDLF